MRIHNGFNDDALADGTQCDGPLAGLEVLSASPAPKTGAPEASRGHVTTMQYDDVIKLPERGSNDPS